MNDCTHARRSARAQHGRGDLAQERIRPRHGGLGLLGTRGVDPLGPGGGCLQRREPLRIDSGIDDELHGGWSRCEGVRLLPRSIDKSLL